MGTIAIYLHVYIKNENDTLEQFKICLLFSNRINHRYKYSLREEVPFPDGPMEEEFIYKYPKSGYIIASLICRWCCQPGTQKPVTQLKP